MATTNSWPAGAPQYANTWTQANQPNTIRSSMDVGPPKVRRRSTAPNIQFQVSMIGTHAQGNAVQSFFDFECQGGVNFHTFLHPFEGTLQTFRIVEPPAITNVSAYAVTIDMVWEQLANAP